METQISESTLIKERLADSLIELSLNPDKLEEFQQNPESILQAMSLSPIEKEIILSGQVQNIYKVLENEHHIYGALVVVAIVVVNYRCGD